MSCDFIVIGSGHNGLACAAYLAKAGARVLVLERSAQVGGGCSTAEATLPGFKHNICSVVHTHIPTSPVYRDLELERHGVKYVYPEHLRGTICPDHESIVMHRDPERMAAELGRISARDAQVFRQLRIGISNGLWKARKARISPGWAADACLDGLELAPGPLPCPDSARPDGSPRARWALISGLTLSSPPSSPHAGAAPPAAGARLRSPW